MSHAGRVHVVDVAIPGLSAVASASLETGGLAGAVEGLSEEVDVIITFGDGSRYLYPAVPAALALGVQSDPESAFSTIRYWPGYHRVG
jgi:hypothetical protein